MGEFWGVSNIMWHPLATENSSVFIHKATCLFRTIQPFIPEYIDDFFEGQIFSLVKNGIIIVVN